MIVTAIIKCKIVCCFEACQ